MRSRIAAVGVGLVLLLLLAALVPATALGADGQTVDTGRITVSLWQAALIALGYYLSNSPWLFGLAYYTLFRPLVAGFLVGCILGDPAQGTLIGAAINVPYLGFISAGGSYPSDVPFAGWLGTTFALAGGLDPGSAVAVAIPLGLLGTLIFYGRMSISAVFAHWADARAEKADIRGVALMNWLPSQILLFTICFFPVLLLALNGSTAVKDVLDRMPVWVSNGLVIAGGILPAVGIALTMRFIFRGSVIPYFFIGFILFTATGGAMSLVVIAALGLALAYLHLTFVGREPASHAETTRKPAAAPVAVSAAPATAGSGVKLTRGDLLRSWVTWTFFSHANYNYERLQGTGFAHAMTPIIRRLYTTPEEIRAALKRHLVFFNTEPNFGNVIHGAVIAMEEQRANGAPIDDDAINSVKSGLMGPISGIGDSLSQSTIAPILLAVGIGIAGGTAGGSTIPMLANAGSGNPLGAIVYAILVSVVIISIGYVAWMQGYLRGRSFVTDLLRSGRIDRVLTGAGVLGNMVLGALAAKWVTIYLATTITIAGASLNLQASVLDPIFPGMLALGAVMLIWWLLKRVNPLLILAGILAISLIGAFPFFGPEKPQGNTAQDYYKACTASVLHPWYPCGAPPAPAPTAAPSETPSATPSATP
jgi:PTS system mannose-specific IID component